MKKTLLLCTVMALFYFYSCKKEDALKDALDAGRISLNSESGEDLEDEEVYNQIYNFIDNVNKYPNGVHDSVSTLRALFLMEAAFNNVFAKFEDSTKITTRIDTVLLSLPLSNGKVSGNNLISGYLDVEADLLSVNEGEVVILADFTIKNASEYQVNFEIIRHIGVSRVAVSAAPETCNAYAADPRLWNPNYNTYCDNNSLYFLALPPLRNSLSKPHGSSGKFWTNIGADQNLDIWYANNQNFWWGHFMSCICWSDFIVPYQVAINQRFSVNPAPNKKVLTYFLGLRLTSFDNDFEHYIRFEIGIPKVMPYNALPFARE
jgi:hypothetical protein